jgi:1-acyl-sn-glycerol-3-phosphate acyltransferase
MTEKFQVPARLAFRRKLLKFLLKPIIHLFFKIKVSGLEHVPVGTGYLLAANHVSHYEPPLILAVWPEFPESMAGHDVWQRGISGKFVALYSAIPVRRGEYDREVIDRALAVLSADVPLLIFPEGGRSHTSGMRRAQPGVAYLVDRAEVPVVPVAVVGTRNDSLRKTLKLQRTTVEIRIGPPFQLPKITGAGEQRRKMRQANADEVMLRIAAMLPEEYHGAYRGQVPSYPAS